VKISDEIAATQQSIRNPSRLAGRIRRAQIRAAGAYPMDLFRTRRLGLMSRSRNSAAPHRSTSFALA
jgi:hypothetical protein